LYDNKKSKHCLISRLKEEDSINIASIACRRFNCNPICWNKSDGVESTDLPYFVQVSNIRLGRDFKRKWSARLQNKSAPPLEVREKLATVSAQATALAQHPMSRGAATAPSTLKCSSKVATSRRWKVSKQWLKKWPQTGAVIRYPCCKEEMDTNKGKWPHTAAVIWIQNEEEVTSIAFKIVVTLHMDLSILKIGKDLLHVSKRECWEFGQAQSHFARARKDENGNRKEESVTKDICNFFQDNLPDEFDFILYSKVLVF
ncbi:hypothetical protein Tco_0725167, partial [Tanacetum coccineum]